MDIGKVTLDRIKNLDGENSFAFAGEMTATVSKVAMGAALVGSLLDVSFAPGTLHRQVSVLNQCDNTKSG
jgi:hypothetical protein